MQYGVLYESGLVLDGSWLCVADVLASYHGASGFTEDRRVTGVLMKRAPGQPWREVHA